MKITIKGNKIVIKLKHDLLLSKHLEQRVQDHLATVCRGLELDDDNPPCGYCGSTAGFEENESGYDACINCHGV